MTVISGCELLEFNRGNLYFGLDLRTGRLQSDKNNTYSSELIIGHVNDKGTTYGQMIDNDGLSEFLFCPSDNINCDVVSDDINDVNPGGSGSKIILVKGFQKDGTALQEFINLNGTTAVQCVNQYYRINNIILISGNHSTEPFNDGGLIKIYNRSTSSADYLCLMKSEVGLSKSGNYYFPPTSTFFGSHIIFSVDTRQDKQMDLLVQSRQLASTGNSTWLTIAELNLNQGAQTVLIPSAPGFTSANQGGEIRLICKNSDGGMNDLRGQVALHGILATPKS